MRSLLIGLVMSGVTTAALVATASTADASCIQSTTCASGSYAPDMSHDGKCLSILC